MFIVITNWQKVIVKIDLLAVYLKIIKFKYVNYLIKQPGGMQNHTCAKKWCLVSHWICKVIKFAYHWEFEKYQRI